MLGQVSVSRQDESGVIEYVEPNVSATHLKIGPEVQSMTDQEILDCHNRILRVQQETLLEYENTAVEIPEGRPQIKRFELGDQWVPRRDVLRCMIDDGEGGTAAGHSHRRP